MKYGNNLFTVSCDRYFICILALNLQTSYYYISAVTSILKIEKSGHREVNLATVNGEQYKSNPKASSTLDSNFS